MPIIEPMDKDKVEEKGWERILRRCGEVGAPDERRAC